MEKQKFAKYVRNFVFGVEDSLVSTVGLLSGVAVADLSKPTIILTGIVLIFVEAFSMGVGSLLSEHSADEFLQKKEIPVKKSLVAGTIMFLSYFFAGFIPLGPYIIWQPKLAFWISIFASLVSLFILGMVGAKILKISLIKHGLQMMLIGGSAVVLGVVVGRVVHSI